MSPAIEPIRRWPLQVARLWNLVRRYTHMYCAGGCGYPVTGDIVLEVDSIGGAPVRMIICGHPDCRRDVLDQPTDSDGIRYSEVRPELVQMGADVDEYKLHFSR